MVVDSSTALSLVGAQRVVELKALPSVRVDVVVTSPPYNIGIRYRSYEDRKPRATYLGWLGEIDVELRRVLHPDGSFFLNVGSTNSDPWVAMAVAAAFRETFVLQNHITWVKSVSIGDDRVADARWGPRGSPAPARIAPVAFAHIRDRVKSGRSRKPWGLEGPFAPSCCRWQDFPYCLSAPAGQGVCRYGSACRAVRAPRR